MNPDRTEGRPAPSSGPHTVFLIGAARSGTKLLRDLLAEHSEIGSIPYDINYLWRIGAGQSHDQLDDGLPTKAAKLVREELAAPGQPIVVEKTVSNTLRVRAIHQAFPDATFVYLARDGVDVVESAMRQWQEPVDWKYSAKKALAYPWLKAPGYALRHVWASVRRGNTDSAPSWGPRYEGIDEDIRSRPLHYVCAQQWARCNAQAIRGFEEAGVQPVLVRFEDVATEPVETVRRIQEQLGVRPVESLATTVRTAPVGKGRRTLDDSQLAEIEPIVNPVEDKVRAFFNTAN